MNSSYAQRDQTKLRNALHQTSRPRRTSLLAVPSPIFTDHTYNQWIYGSGFQTGFSAQYNGTSLVARSFQLSQPIIYVSFNYRLNTFGFLAGKEIKDAGVGNLGLYDREYYVCSLYDFESGC